MPVEKEIAHIFLCGIIHIFLRYRVIVLSKTVVCPGVLTTGGWPNLFPKKFGKSPNQNKTRAKSKKEIKKEPGETKFLGLLWESFFRDNVLVCGGQAHVSYLIMEATSAAKSSSAFSMPSPVANRVKAFTVMVPPSCLATSATCFSTEVLFSFTKACCSRQFSS